MDTLTAASLFANALLLGAVIWLALDRTKPRGVVSRPPPQHTKTAAIIPMPKRPLRTATPKPSPARKNNVPQSSEPPASVFVDMAQLQEEVPLPQELFALEGENDQGLVAMTEIVAKEIRLLSLDELEQCRMTFTAYLESGRGAPATRVRLEHIKEVLIAAFKSVVAASPQLAGKALVGTNFHPKPPEAQIAPTLRSLERTLFSTMAMETPKRHPSKPVDTQPVPAVIPAADTAETLQQPRLVLEESVSVNETKPDTTH